MKHMPTRSSCPVPVHAHSASHLIICTRVNLVIYSLLIVEKYCLVRLVRSFICMVVQLLLTSVGSIQTKLMYLSASFYQENSKQISEYVKYVAYLEGIRQRAAARIEYAFAISVRTKEDFFPFMVWANPVGQTHLNYASKFPQKPVCLVFAEEKVLTV